MKKKKGWLDRLRDYAGWPTTPAPKRKSILVRLQDGKRHRVDADGRIIGKTAQKRHDRALRKAQAQNSDQV